jgi:hypothetical protein
MWWPCCGGLLPTEFYHDSYVVGSSFRFTANKDPVTVVQPGRCVFFLCLLQCGSYAMQIDVVLETFLNFTFVR